MNLFTKFAETTAERLDETAICWGDEQLDYRWVRERTNGLAGKLTTAFGVQPGDRVAVWLKNQPEFNATLFGVWQAGGVVVMINNFLKPDEVDFILSDSEAKVVITDSSLDEARAELETRDKDWQFIKVEDYDQWASAEAPAPVDRREEDLAALLYTSGTTGNPKGAMLTHGNFLHNVASCIVALEIVPGDRLVVILPQFHSFMFTVGTLAPMLAGIGIVLLKSIHPFKNVLIEIIKHRGTILPAVPAIYRSLNQATEIPPLPLRLCISGGAPLPVEVLKEFQNKFPYTLLEGYGPTETSPVATVNPVSGPWKAGSVGVPIPNVELTIRDEAGGELPVGDTGEICIRGGNVMQGYWKQPEETDKVLRDGWLYTGDIGHGDGDGYFYITDRKKDMLLVNGINVYPREIEEVIHQFPGVKEAAVIGVKDSRKGEQPIAYVAPNEGGEINARELRTFVKERMADYKVPREVRILENLPRNATGKILKTKLRELALEQAS
jgi:long-chain acyl-CoA synthetase